MDPAPGGAARLATHSALTRAATYAVGLPGSIFLARGLGAEGRGIYQLPVTAVAILLYVMAAGVPQALFRQWTPARLVALRSAATSLAVALGLAGVGVGLAVFALARNLLFVDVPTLAYVLALLSLPLQIHLGMWSALLTYARGGRQVNNASALAVLLQSVAFVVGALTGWLTVSRTCGIYLAGVAVQWIWISRCTARLRLDGPQTAGPRPRSLLITGLRFQPYVVANFLLLRMDVLFLARFGTFEEVGHYAVAVALAEIVWGLTDSVLLPAVERASNTDDVAETEFGAATARMTVLLGGAGALVVAVAAPLVVPVIYGSEFGDAVGPLLVLLPGVIFMGVWRVWSLSTIRFGSPWVQPTISVAALVVNGVLNIAFISHLGATGAALASTLSYLLVMALTLRWVVRSGGLQWPTLVPGRADVRRLRSFASEWVGRT